MERAEGYFKNLRKRNLSIGVYISILSGATLLILTLLLESAWFIFLLFLFGIAVLVVLCFSNNPSKTKANMPTKLILTKDGEIFRIEQTICNKTEILFDNLKWRELIIVERIATVRVGYYNYHDVITARQLQLRIWNDEEQIVLIEKLDKQTVEGIKTFKMRELHRADFVSLEPGTLQKMNELMNISESIWE